MVRVIEERHRVDRIRQPQRTLVMAKARDSATFSALLFR